MPKNPFEYPIRCDCCNKQVVYTVRNKNNAIHSAKMNGWSFGKKRKCPKCNGIVPVKIGDIRILKSNNHRVEITEIRDLCYSLPIWYIDLETHIPNGCRITDLIQGVPNSSQQ